MVYTPNRYFGWIMICAGRLCRQIGKCHSLAGNMLTQLMDLTTQCAYRNTAIKPTLFNGGWNFDNQMGLFVIVGSLPLMTLILTMSQVTQSCFGLHWECFPDPRRPWQVKRKAFLILSLLLKPFTCFIILEKHNVYAFSIISQQHS